MEWAATLNEYEKLVIRMNTPRSVFINFSPVSIWDSVFLISDLSEMKEPLLISDGLSFPVLQSRH